MIRQDLNWYELREQFVNAEPFDHVIIDDFWRPEVAEKLVEEFPDYESDTWNAHWQNAIENKKGCNHWDKFPSITYKAFQHLNGFEFTNRMRHLTDKPDLHMDIGLHGGGWHSHTRNGNLNMHLDYNIHPKLGLQRKINIIIYMTPNWQPEWKGGLELWSHDPETNRPKERVVTVENKFNRAVLFDTTQNSWHGLPSPLLCPEGVVRQSMAAYYVCTPEENAEQRFKALFAPREDQAGDPEIEELIRRRSNLNTASSAYKG
jgi:Rps23 Pro-64 3,4-dihydroxylase Tpa1-like proline 4-hydroxylase